MGIALKIHLRFVLILVIVFFLTFLCIYMLTHLDLLSLLSADEILFTVEMFETVTDDKDALADYSRGSR